MISRMHAASILPSLLHICILLVPGSARIGNAVSSISHDRTSMTSGFTHDRGKRNVPEFDVLLPNLTIKQGSDASFTCVVKNLGEYKVAWIRSEDKAIIAWGSHMVTHNHRFSVTHNGHNTWTLHIKNVQQNDTGSYMCQVNTDPQRSQFGTLTVVVPADIIDTETSGDMRVAEGQSATLKCKASGHPPPKVRWKRQDGQPLPVSRELLSNPLERVDVWEGERLPLRPLQRADTGSYLCIANNSVPPFKPSIKVMNQLVAAPLGVNITLECIVEGVPKPNMNWFNKDSPVLIHSPGKIETEYVYLKDYLLRMRLTIFHLRREDFTEYNCSAENEYGIDSAVIKLQQLTPIPTVKPTTTTATYIDGRRPIKHGNGKYNSDGSVNTSHGNIKHAKNHRRKFQRKGHHGEGNDISEGYGEDSSLDADTWTTVPSSAGGGLLGDRSNSRNSQRSGMDGSNSINSYNSRNRNSGFGGGAIDDPNLDAPSSSSRSSRLISVRLSSNIPSSSLHRIFMSMMVRFHSQLQFFTVAIMITMIPISTCHFLFNI